MTLDDAVEFHVLRTQPEVMIFTTTGKVDVDLDATSTWIKRFVHPNDSKTFVFAIEELVNPGVIIGTVGSQLAEPPLIGYASTPDLCTPAVFTLLLWKFVAISRSSPASR